MKGKIFAAMAVAIVLFTVNSVWSEEAPENMLPYWEFATPLVFLSVYNEIETAVFTSTGPTYKTIKLEPDVIKKYNVIGRFGVWLRTDKGYSVFIDHVELVPSSWEALSNREKILFNRQLTLDIRIFHEALLITLEVDMYKKYSQYLAQIKKHRSCINDNQCNKEEAEDKLDNFEQDYNTAYNLYSVNTHHFDLSDQFFFIVDYWMEQKYFDNNEEGFKAAIKEDRESLLLRFSEITHDYANAKKILSEEK